MQFPESWLREFCNPPLTTQQLADTLTMAGLEVEELQAVAPPFTGVVVGEIKAAVQHPNADRLRVCQVDVGPAGGVLSIVCGAPNARVGIKVPCALVGAQLPPGADGQGLTIKLGQLRGVESQGMLCSARELQIIGSEEAAGLLELSSDAPVGQDIRACLALDDTLFTLKLTPNLAHHLSIYGVARELAALTGSPLKPLAAAAIAPHAAPHAAPDAQDAALRVPVTVSAPALCGRFSGRVLRHLNTRAATPSWMVDRLARCGQRSVNALVDISNYMMFERGQPSHIFDLDKIQGGLQVRWGQPGESLELLNGQTITVDDTVGVVADDAQVESLAGIMGGQASAVSDSTQHVYVEAAFWWPAAITGRSRRFNFSSEAGHRFERGVDPSLTVASIERITQLILEICGTAQTLCGPVDDQQPNMPPNMQQAQALTLRVSRAARVVGMPLSRAQCVDALQGLGLSVQSGADADVLTVTVPSYRFDLRIEEDLIEEVARTMGYQNLPATPPVAPVTAQLRAEAQRSPFTLRRALAALGYQETINFSFVPERWEHELAGNPQPIKLLNPISSSLNVMRSSLLGSLVQVLQFNLDRKASRVHVFELGRVFLRDAHSQNTDSTVAGFDQPMRLAGLAYGPRSELHWSAPDQALDFFDVKGDIETLLGRNTGLTFTPASHPALHPGRAAQVFMAGRAIGFVGELHPQWRQAYGLPQAPLLFELELDALLARQVPVFQAVSKFQPVDRDLAVVLPEHVSCAEVMAAIQGADTHGRLQEARLFDVYRPEQNVAGMQTGEKSLALRLVLSSQTATLTEEEIEASVQAVISHLNQKLGARLRA